MRPRNLDEYIGQDHILGANKPLRVAVEKGVLHSMILWGPPGVGKTSFARLLADCCDAHFESISAVLSGVKDIRAAIDRAKNLRLSDAKDTILFVDEIHRFNKTQQDAFLPFVEDGTVIFVGATTENPSFELNNALLSRARVYTLKKLSEVALTKLIMSALNDERGLAHENICIDQELISLIAKSADGDARKTLNILEIASDLAEVDGESKQITRSVLQEVMQSSLKQFDKGGDIFYEQISALHKSVRGSDPDGALYWYVRMLDGGCDPLYIARRVVRMASEDIGNADPRALQVALNAWDTQTRLGAPEGELTIAQAIIYLAVAAKSNAVYTAFNQCRADIKASPAYDVPEHLRNAPTQLMKDIGYGEEYRYAHDEPNAFAAGENYFPEEMRGTVYYNPVDRGLEVKISDKLRWLREQNRVSDKKRYHSD
ncbi:replication-associated recombination protein A [Alkalimarinus sediminis]|uniref:Replication-associated recombination protein A n=1 Tax=Alkalimarinus sediminis TaxID=1632866 RepID=A0A9E8HLI4_9ALTE|nr:replication-associated recombination protein A [Alkalimarinus sediminis]UZW76800.1 replication-associated recombination protein A [Alkalimarinus sediminis]